MTLFMMRKNDSLVVLYKSLSLLLLIITLTLLVACDGNSEPNIETTVVPTVQSKIAKTVAAVTPESLTPTVVPTVPVEIAKVVATATLESFTPIVVSTVPAKIAQVVATATPESFTPTPVLPPTTSKVTSKLIPTSTPTTNLLLSVQRQLEWPIDVGTSHFGALGNELDGFSGAWVRPLPGRFIWGLMEPSEGD